KGRTASDAFEVFEGFQALVALVRRLAGRRTELADPRCPLRRATGAMYGALRKQAAFARAALRRRDSVPAQLLPARLTQPFGRPGRRQHALDGYPLNAIALELRDDHLLDHLGRRTTGVGWRHMHLDTVRLEDYVPHSAQVHDTEHRDLGVGYRMQKRTDVLERQGSSLLRMLLMLRLVTSYQRAPG